jgi:hypothetical protein
METSMRKLLRPTRRLFLAGGASLIAAPAIVKAQGVLVSRYPPGGYVAQALDFPTSLEESRPAIHGHCRWQGPNAVILV